MRKRIIFIFLTVFIFWGCATVNYVDLSEGQAERTGVVHFYIVDNANAYSFRARYISDPEAPFYESEALGDIGKLDGKIPGIQVTLPEGTHGFYLGSYKIYVTVSEGMITPVSISTCYYSNEFLGNWMEIVPYVHKMVKYSADWEPSIEDSLVIRDSYENPAFFIGNNAWRVAMGRITMDEFDTRINEMANAVPLTEHEMNLYFKAIGFLFADQTMSAVDFRMVALAEKYASVIKILDSHITEE